jgi:hypothetical protein
VPIPSAQVEKYKNRVDKNLSQKEAVPENWDSLFLYSISSSKHISAEREREFQPLA